ncbi:unnamed protein product [Arabidopsis lyrata]|nr:unnamed protein product [Arabidopsis lyrata]
MDGTGDYKTVMEAIIAAPVNSKLRYIIYVKKGIYNEIVKIEDTKTNLIIIGDGRDDTILSGNLNANDGIKTYDSATLGVNGNGFMARAGYWHVQVPGLFMAQDICIRNTAGPAKGQAVALRVSAEAVVIHRCRIEAYQDSLYAHWGKQFYSECYITGTVDFICGHATAVFQHCQIEARKPKFGQSNVITAHSRTNPSDKSGFSIQKCNITASSELAPVRGTIKTYLGRPWGNFSRVIFLESFMDALIDPAGYIPWNKSDIETLSTLSYIEYKNKGLGAVTTNRVQWKGFKVMTDPKEAIKFTVGKFINQDFWLNSTGVPLSGSDSLQIDKSMAAAGNKSINAKLVLLGDVGAGKSSLVLRFVKDQFVEFQESTIGAAFFSQTLAVNDATVKFEIWDTAGQERYHSLAPMYYRGAAAAIIVFDVTNQASFERAKKWVQELQAQGIV